MDRRNTYKKILQIQGWAFPIITKTQTLIFWKHNKPQYESIQRRSDLGMPQWICIVEDNSKFLKQRDLAIRNNLTTE